MLSSCNKLQTLVLHCWWINSSKLHKHATYGLLKALRKNSTTCSHVAFRVRFLVQNLMFIQMSGSFLAWHIVCSPHLWRSCQGDSSNQAHMQDYMSQFLCRYACRVDIHSEFGFRADMKLPSHLLGACELHLRDRNFIPRHTFSRVLMEQRCCNN